jgi:hypothetical protein
MTVLNASLQLTLPQWVRSRGAATYIFVFMGTMAIGSVLWGLVAETLGTRTALTVSAALLVVVAASTAVLPLRPGTGTVDRTISSTWSTPTLVVEPEPTDGPVLVTVAYTVRPAELERFRTAMRGVEGSRRRTGGYRWRLYRSGEEQDVMLESFMVPSWGEYRRQHTQRFTGRDRELQVEALRYADGTPTERHYFPVKPSR